jgi:signal peptidase I
LARLLLGLYALVLAASLARPGPQWGLSRLQRGLCLLLVCLASCLHQFVFRIYYVTSHSMVPTLNVRDVVLVWLPSRTPKVGDIVVFGQPALVKRYIANAGESVELLGGEIFIQNQAHPELPKGGGDWGPHLVKTGHFFALGDNRNNSDDSRSRGDFPCDALIGKAIFRLWPPQAWGRLR